MQLLIRDLKLDKTHQRVKLHRGEKEENVAGDEKVGDREEKMKAEREEGVRQGQQGGEHEVGRQI